MTDDRKAHPMSGHSAHRTGYLPPTGNVVAAGDFLTDGTRAVLRITRCRDCGSAWFPARTQCSTCASRNVVAELTPDTGTVYASTVVQIAPPGFQAPYVLSYTDIGDVRALTHASTDAALPPGTAVQVRLTTIGADYNGPVLSYGVAPIGDQS
jgi:uncharacterized OB-fold protein